MAFKPKGPAGQQGGGMVDHGNEFHTPDFLDVETDPSIDSSLKGVTKTQVQDHAPKAHTLASHSTKSHTELTDIGTNTHAQIDSHIAAGGGGLGYTLMVQALTSSPGDNATVYFGMLPKTPTTSANINKIYIRKAGTIKIAEIYCYSGTAGTAEAWSLYIRKNNSADTLIATLSVSASERVFSNTGLNIAVAVGDYIEIKGVQPLWATNPLTTIYGGYVYVE